MVAREVINSRGVPTVEVEIETRKGIFRACSPTTMNPNPKELADVRDEDISRYAGNGVLKAIQLLNEVIAPKLVGMDPTRQTDIDDILMRQEEPRLGVNAAVAVSMAVRMQLE